MDYLTQEIFKKISSTKSSPGWYFWLTLTPGNRTETTVDINYVLRIQLWSSESWSGDGIPFFTVIKVGDTSHTRQVKSNSDIWSGTTMREFKGVFTAEATNSITELPVTLRNYTTSTRYPNAGGTLVETSGLPLTIPAYEYPYSIPTVDSAKLGTAFTVQMNRARETYTHTVQVELGSYSQSYQNVGTSVNFNIPKTYASAFTSPYMNAAITATTYDGDTAIGTYTGTFPVYLPDDAVPTISTSVTYDNTGLPSEVRSFPGYVKGYSKVKSTITGTAKYSGTISSYGLQIGSEELTSSSRIITSGTLQQTGSVQVISKVTDSRGVTATKTDTISVIEYAKPTLNGGEFTRVNGQTRFTCSGSYTTLGGYNAPTVNVTWLGQTFPVTLTASMGGFTGVLNIGGDVPGTKTEATVVVTDKLGESNTYTIALPSHEIPLEMNAAGDAVGIGKTPGGHRSFEVGWDMSIGDSTTNLKLLLNGAEVGGVEYSTEKETIVGKWINSKPIYRKVWYKGNIASGSSSLTVALDNPETIIAVAGIADEGAAMSNAHFQLPYVNPSDARYEVGLFYRSGAINFRAGTAGAAKNAYVWIDYTKTTD